MYLLAILCTLLVAASADKSCYFDVLDACKHDPPTTATPNCDAKYGNIDLLEPDLHALANGHIEKSFEFLLMSTHFGTYEYNREGFKGLYRKFSDHTWNKAIDAIKFITQRGGRMNFNQLPHWKSSNPDISKSLQINELPSLAKALDTQKQLAKDTFDLHSKATTQHADAGIAHYLEEEFMESQSEAIRTLTGHASDLKSMLNNNAALATFLFDEYLKKTL